jgi:hypothetical protein
MSHSVAKSVAKSWPNPTLSSSPSRGLSAPSIHFEYARKSMFALVCNCAIAADELDPRTVERTCTVTADASADTRAALVLRFASSADRRYILTPHHGRSTETEGQIPCVARFSYLSLAL